MVEYSELTRIGSSKPVRVDVRLVGATNEDLPGLVRAGRFRADLLDRLSFEVVTLPPLRARAEDVAALAEHFARRMASELGWQRFPGFSRAALAAIEAHDWPGNVRELKNVITQSAMLAADRTITGDTLRFPSHMSARATAALPDPEPGFDLTAFLDRSKEQLILRAMEKAGNIQARAARLFGLTPQAVNQFLKSRNHQ